MEQTPNSGCVADDDEDLEQLRLAALKSLKKPVLGVHSEKATPAPVLAQKPFYSKNGVNNRVRGSFHGRTHRNGQFNHRTRNTNLIAVPLISTDTDDTTTVTTTTNNSSSKLILPQDRYCKSNSTAEEKSEEQSSKFNRYNDKSDSESESDDDDHDDDEQEEEEGKEDEGGEKKLQRSNSLEALMQELENEIEGRSKSEEGTNNTKVKVKVKKAKKKVEEVVEEKKPTVVEEQKFEKKPPPPPPEKKVVEAKFEKNKMVVTPPPPQPVLLPVQPAYVAPPPVQPYYPPPPVYNSLPPIVPVIHYEPPIRYERIPSPLTIDTDLLNTTVTAPLSPRSAAFVMQNREIIERRKRRSYSRSPSPRYRRSRTKSRSPKTPPSRRRVTTTPPEKKSSVYDRLGARIEKSESPVKKKRSRSRSPQKLLDPVLEARKKKFESNELKIKEGVIRLKPKNDDQDEDGGESVVEEEADDVIDVTVDDLFSDEETDNENEGRFKTGGGSSSSSSTVRDKDTKKSGGGGGRSSYQRLTTNKENKRRLMKKAQLSRLMVRNETKHKMAPPVSTLPEKKIEIKIRNPTKYEEKKETKAVAAAAAPRKVEIGPRIERVESGEIVEESVDDEEEEDDYDAEVIDLNEGDLRAQLSRKRAERQCKHTSDETVASRLLQSALESAVFKKAKHPTKTKTSTRDGKLPIHSRLGLTQQPVKKKRKRSKRGGTSGGGLDQERWMELPVF